MKQLLMVVCAALLMTSCTKENPVELQPTVTEAASIVQFENTYSVDYVVPNPCNNETVHVTGNIHFTETFKFSGEFVDYSYISDYNSLIGVGSVTNNIYNGVGKISNHSRAVMVDGMPQLISGHFMNRFSLKSPQNTFYTLIMSQVNVSKDNQINISNPILIFDSCK